MARLSTIPLITSRLEKLREVGPREWVACCPAHSDSSPSLTLRETDDGRILMHCFAGCSIESILTELGLRMEDLFPEPLTHHASKIKHPFSPAAVLRALAKEVSIAAIATSDAAENKLSTTDRKRMLLAVERINEAVRYV